MADVQDPPHDPDDEDMGAPNWVQHGWNLLKRKDVYSPLPKDLKDQITNETICDAKKLIYEKEFVVETPVLDGKNLLGMGSRNSIQLVKSFGMKCENLQLTGSFKMRGASHQFLKVDNIDKEHLLTISAGNYGASFATLAKDIGVAQRSHVFMPRTIPHERKDKIEAFGVNVNCAYPQDQLLDGINVQRRRLQDAGFKTTFFHPFDDVNVVLGHASAGLELLKQVPDVDIVLVCCGGGGFLAGVTAAIRLHSSRDIKIYGVEHTISCTMFDSLQKNEVAHMTEDPAKTVCHGISAPFTGIIPFKIFRAFGDGIIKITDEEAIGAVKLLYKSGLVVEPSGAAAFAAVMSNKVPDIDGKNVVAFITGGNVSPQELVNLGL